MVNAGLVSSIRCVCDAQNIMMRKKYKLIILTLAISLIVFAILCLFEAKHYPRIARSAYIRYPHLLVKATYKRICPGKGVSLKNIIHQANQIYPEKELNAFRLYLSDKPDNDRSIEKEFFA